MFPQDMHIEAITGVLYGRRPFPAGAVRDWTAPRRCCELILIISGKGTVTHREATFGECAGSVRFMPATDRPDRYLTETTEPGDYCYFTFLSSDAPKEMLRAQLRHPEALTRIFLDLWRTWTTRQEGWYHRAVGLAYGILSELENRPYLSHRSEDVLAPAIEEIERHLTDGVDVSRLHERCGIGYTYFKRLFIRRFGIPPRRYITKLRMNIACEQLARGERTVTEIAEMLGYAGVSYFSRVFHHEVGCTAEGYRRRTGTGAGEYQDAGTQAP